MNLGGINPLSHLNQAPIGRPQPASGAQGGGNPWGADGLGASIPAAPAKPVVYPSGLQLLRDQGGVAYQAVLPAGPFLPVQVAVLQGADGSVRALLQTAQPTPVAAQHGSDGKVYVQVDPTSPNLITFDPTSGEYGITSQFQQRQDGAVTREKAETIAPDGTRTSIFNEVTTAQGKQFTRITEGPGGRLHASEISESNAPAGKSTLGGAGRAMGLGGANNVQENPLSVKKGGDQGYDVSGGSLLGQVGASTRNGFNGFFDWKSAPVWKWLDGRKQTELHLTPLSAMGVGAIFPGLAQLQAPAATSATPAAAATTATAPTVKVQLGDITRVPADGLITAVNSEGMWMGGVDGAIARAGGGQFHQQAQVLIGKQDGQVKVAGTQQPHQGLSRAWSSWWTISSCRSMTF